MGSAASNLFCSYLTFRRSTEHGLYQQQISATVFTACEMAVKTRCPLLAMKTICSPSLFFTTFSVKISDNAWYTPALTTMIGPVCSDILEIILHLIFHTLSQKCSTSFFRREGGILCLFTVLNSVLEAPSYLYTQKELMKTVSLKFLREISYIICGKC